MGVKKIYCMTCGFYDFQREFILPGDGSEKRISIAMGMFLLEHEKGYALVDTGCAPQCAVDPAGYLGLESADWGILDMKPEDAVDRQLQRIGIEAPDVGHVVLTHMHFDHAGGMSLFPNAVLYVQKEELLAAMWPEPKYSDGYYEIKDFEGTRNFNVKKLDGDHDIFGDGAVRLLRTGGHSRGHQMVLARMEKSGLVLLPGDACYMQRSLDKMLPPGDPIPEPEAARAALERVRDFAGAGARLLFSHPFREDWKRYPQPPDFID
ncbi:MAG: N-acyl homoserine lactonase family protein [bacterium]